MLTITIPRGVPSHDDRHLFEMLILEGAQAGLSWSTILNKRAGYREAFADFDVDAVARFTPKRIESCWRIPGSCATARRSNRRSPMRAPCSASAKSTVRSPRSWSFVGDTPVQNAWQSYRDAPASTEQSDALSKALKAYGCKFVGSTICYALMQATGMVNDHEVGCPCHAQCAALGGKPAARRRKAG